MKILCQGIYMLLFFLSVSPLLSQVVDCDTVPDLGIELQINGPNFPFFYEGDKITVDFISTGLTNITLFQFILGFDPTVLSFIDNGNNPTPGSSLIEVSVLTNNQDVDQGKLPIIWQHDWSVPTTLPDGGVLMSACFRAQQSGDCTTLMTLGEFTTNPTFQAFASADYDSGDPSSQCLLDIVFNTADLELCIDCERLTVTEVSVCNSNGCLGFSSCGGTYPVTYQIINDNGGPAIGGVINAPGEIEKYNSLPSGLYIIEMRDADGNPATRQINIDRTFPEIQLATTLVHPRCSNTNDGEIQYAISGGVSDYNLLLSNGLNFQDETGSIENLINGTYDITVTDAVGCTATFPAIDIFTPPLVLDIEVDSFACLRAVDGQIRVKASGGTPFPGNEYNINNTVTDCWIQEDPMNVSFVFNEADTCFNIEVRDALSCPIDTCIKIPLRNRFQFEFDTIPPSCNDLGYTSTINITSSERYLISLFTETGALIQSFGNNTFQENLEDLSPGNYRWQLQETMGDMCIENFEFTIPDFSIMPIELTTSGIQPDCGQENGSATITITNGIPPYSFNWEYDPTIDSNMLTDIPGGLYNVTITDGRNCEKDTFVDLQLGAFLTIEGSIIRDLDCNDNSITAQLMVAFDGYLENELIFEWYTDAEGMLGSTPTLETDTAGVYYIDVNTLAGDCLLTDTLEILAPGMVTFEYNFINPASCDILNPVKGSIEIINIAGGTGPYNCRWYFGDLSTPYGPITDITCSRNNLEAGLYLIEIIDNSNGCRTVAEITLFNDDNVDFEPILTPPTCPGDTDGTIAIGGVTGGPILTCTWDDPTVVAIGCVASNLAAGSYTVNILDENGCEKDTTFVLLEPEIFTAEVVDSISTSCVDGADGIATVMITSNPQNLSDFTILWSNNEQDVTNVSATNFALDAGANTVSILDGNCSVVLDFSIPQPIIATLDNSTEIIMTNCAGSCDASVDLIASGGVAPSGNYSFFWELDGVTSASRNDLCVGEYIIRITDENNCEYPDTIYVTEPDTLTLNITELIGLGCENDGTGGSITVEANGGCGDYTYSWSDGQSTGSSATDLVADTYGITVTDGCGCTKEIEAEISGITPIFAELEITGEANCPGDRICLGINQNTITGGSGVGYKFTLSEGGLGDLIPIDSCILLLPGPYTVTVFDITRCRFEFGLINISGPNDFSVNLGPDLDAELGDEAIEITAVIDNSFPIVNIAWSLNEEWACIDPAFCETIAFVPTTNSLITVVVTDENGCTAVDDMQVNLTANRRVYFPTAFLPGSDVDNRFMIQTGLGVDAIEDFIVYDKWGNKMFELPDAVKDFPHSKDDGWDGRKNNRNVEPGVYVWVANVRFSDDKIIQYNGQITLIR